MTEVLVCGSAVVDMVFEVDAFPSEPEKYAARTARIVGGGCAGNAAVAVARLGGVARLAARCGADLQGDLMREGLEAEGVDLSLVQVAQDGRSAFSSILIDAGGERQIVAFRGAALPRDLPAGGLGSPAAVLADTRWPQAAVAVLSHAREIGVPGVLDGEAPVEGRLVELASHTVFSAQGVRDFTGLEDLTHAVKAVATPGRWVAVTDGAAGTLYVDQAGEMALIPPPKVTAVDTLGAGDVWHGAFALWLGDGAEEAEAVRFANAAAALKCTRRGGREGTPTREQTLDLMQRTYS